MQTYRMRAECATDVARFLALFGAHIHSLSLYSTHFPDVDVTFGSMLSLDSVRLSLQELPDSHVMLGTIAHIADYTGERTE